MVGLPPPDGPDARAARRRGRPDRPARAGRAVDDEAKGKQIWRYRFPEQDYDLGRGEVYDPANKQARPNDSPFTGRSARSSRSTRRCRHPRPEARRRRAAPACRRAARLGPHEGPPGRADRPRDVGRRQRHPGVRDRSARRATSCSGCRHGRVSGSTNRCAAEARPSSTAARRLVVTLDHSTLADPGPAGFRQDLHRGADDLLAPRRGEAGRASPATSHKVIGNLLKAVLVAAGRRRHRRPRRPARRRRPGPRRPAGRAGQGRDGCPRATRRRSGEPGGGHVLAVGVLEDDRGGRRPVRRRGRPDLARQRHRHRPRDRQPRPARRPATARPAAQGHASARCRRSALAHILGDAATMPPTRGLFLERTWRLHPDLCAFTSEVFYDDRLEPEPHLEVQRLISAGSFLDGTGPRRLDVATSGRRQRVPGRGRRRRGRRPVARRGRRRVDQREGHSPGGRLGRRPDRRAVQRPGRRDPGDGSREEARVGTVDKFQGQEAPISIYSMTTSTPGARAARHELPVQPPPTQRRDVARPMRRGRRRVARRSSASSARTPEQMRLANAFCRFGELRTTREDLSRCHTRGRCTRSRSICR